MFAFSRFRRKNLSSYSVNVILLSLAGCIRIFGEPQRAAVVVAVLLVAVPIALAAERSGSSPIVYYASDRTVSPQEEAQALAAYNRKYQLVTPGKNERFTRPKVSQRTYPRTSPGGTLLPNGTVRFAAIITPEGRVTKPVVLNAPQDYLGLSVIGVLPAWRCKPALLNGTPVAAILIYELNVRRPGAEQNPRMDSGLGHLPRQDR